jgi:hypothetical protein
VKGLGGFSSDLVVGAPHEDRERRLDGVVARASRRRLGGRRRDLESPIVGLLDDAGEDELVPMA